MAEKMTSINPKMLLWARESSGTSEVEAYAKFGYEKLVSWEKGEDFPTYAQLKSLCAYYRKPVAVCFFPEPPSLKNLTTSYRTLPSQLLSRITRNVHKVIDDARVMQLNLYELSEGSNASIEGFKTLGMYNSSISEAALKLRELLKAPLSEQKQLSSLEDAFEYWRDRLHSIGIYVFKDAFRDERVSGLCLYDDIYPVIYVNNSFASSRQIFTLFHETYHLISGTGGIDFLDDLEHGQYCIDSSARIERNCNAFAGAFLVPESDFRCVGLNLSPTDLNISKLAKSYSVSREVILRKYLDFGRITQEDYLERSTKYNSDYFRNRLKTKKGGGNYYKTQGVYKGRHYLELAFGKYYSRKISVFQLARYMNMRVSSVQVLAQQKGWGSL